jgi:hypothetical protein
MLIERRSSPRFGSQLTTAKVVVDLQRQSCYRLSYCDSANDMINIPSRGDDDCKKEIVAVFRCVTASAPAMMYKSRLPGDFGRFLKYRLPREISSQFSSNTLSLEVKLSITSWGSFSFLRYAHRSLAGLPSLIESSLLRSMASVPSAFRPRWAVTATVARWASSAARVE